MDKFDSLEHSVANQIRDRHEGYAWEKDVAHPKIIEFLLDGATGDATASVLLEKWESLTPESCALFSAPYPEIVMDVARAYLIAINRVLTPRGGYPGSMSLEEKEYRVLRGVRNLFEKAPPLPTAEVREFVCTMLADVVRTGELRTKIRALETFSEFYEHPKDLIPLRRAMDDSQAESLSRLIEAGTDAYSPDVERTLYISLVRVAKPDALQVLLGLVALYDDETGQFICGPVDLNDRLRALRFKRGCSGSRGNFV